MKKGIVIYALGHQNYYLMAEALAASLRVNGASESGISIAIICDDDNKITYPSLFDDTVLLNSEAFMEEGKIVFNNATVMVYDLTPYDETIKLDADMIWIKGMSPAKLFEELKDIELTFSNRGHGWDIGNSVWTEEEDILSTYKLTKEAKLYKIYGEFLYFKRCANAKKYFKVVKDVYKRRRVKCRAFSNGSFTDELAFQIACMITNIYPHKDNFTPIYNMFLGYQHLVRKYPYQLEGFYGYSIGGNATNDFTKANYETLANVYYKKLGLSRPYRVSNKRSFLPERKNL